MAKIMYGGQALATIAATASSGPTATRARTGAELFFGPSRAKGGTRSPAGTVAVSIARPRTTPMAMPASASTAS
eukprot:9488239-Pyramimonas_sp.AAC.1